MPQHLVFYWTYYAREWQDGLLRFRAPSTLFHKARRGDIVWALTRRGKGDYVFVGRFIVERANPPTEHRYGRYSISCIRDLSALIDASGQRWTEAKLRRLFGFDPSEKPLGQWFHGPSCVRELPEKTAGLLERERKSWPELDATAASPFGAVERQAPPGIPAVDYERVLGQIARRRGQKDFRDALFKAFGARCAITGCKVPAVLEGAHIIRVADRKDKGSNGLLLRSDIHTLFDLYLISINPQSFRVWVAPSVRRVPYKRFHRSQASVPKPVRSRAMLANLARHYRKAKARSTLAGE